MSVERKKAKERICCLPRGQAFVPLAPGEMCATRSHRHMYREVAQRLVDQGVAAWVESTYTTVNGKGITRERRLAEPAINLVPPKTWQARQSRDCRGSMKVMQLVV